MLQNCSKSTPPQHLNIATMNESEAPPGRAGTVAARPQRRPQPQRYCTCGTSRQFSALSGPSRPVVAQRQGMTNTTCTTGASTTRQYTATEESLWCSDKAGTMESCLCGTKGKPTTCDELQLRDLHSFRAVWQTSGVTGTEQVGARYQWFVETPGFQMRTARAPSRGSCVEFFPKSLRDRGRNWYPLKNHAVRGSRDRVLRRQHPDTR